jgi:hypothetical protein
MNLAVLLSQDTANPRGLPGVWPAEVRELGTDTTLPDVTWLLMTTAEYTAYLAQYQSLFDAWLAANPRISGDKSGSLLNAVGHMITCGFSGIADIGRSLEIVANNPTITTPFIVTEAANITSMAVYNGLGSTSGTISLYLNGVSALSIDLTSSQKNVLPGLSIPLVAGDQLFWKVAAGSFSKVNVYTLIQSTIDV